MTRDEQRAKFAKTMADALHDMTDDDPFSPEQELRIAYFILDSLHGIAFVNPIETTEEMWKAADDEWIAAEGYIDFSEFWRAMAAAGDLTNPQETKP